MQVIVLKTVAFTQIKRIIRNLIVVGMSMGLYETNAALLRATKTPYSLLAKEIGCNVSWVYRYRNEELGDPGTAKSEKLYYLLSGKTLKLVKA
jgi:hypothetical protein